MSYCVLYINAHGFVLPSAKTDYGTKESKTFLTLSLEGYTSAGNYYVPSTNLDVIRKVHEFYQTNSEVPMSSEEATVEFHALKKELQRIFAETPSYRSFKPTILNPPHDKSYVFKNLFDDSYVLAKHGKTKNMEYHMKFFEEDKKGIYVVKSSYEKDDSFCLVNYVYDIDQLSSLNLLNNPEMQAHFLSAVSKRHHSDAMIIMQKMITQKYMLESFIFKMFGMMGYNNVYIIDSACNNYQTGSLKFDIDDESKSSNIEPSDFRALPHLKSIARSIEITPEKETSLTRKRNLQMRSPTRKADIRRKKDAKVIYAELYDDFKRNITRIQRESTIEVPNRWTWFSSSTDETSLYEKQILDAWIRAKSVMPQQPPKFSMAIQNEITQDFMRFLHWHKTFNELKLLLFPINAALITKFEQCVKHALNITSWTKFFSVAPVVKTDEEIIDIYERAKRDFERRNASFHNFSEDERFQIHVKICELLPDMNSERLYQLLSNHDDEIYGVIKDEEYSQYGDVSPDTRSPVRKKDKSVGGRSLKTRKK